MEFTMHIDFSNSEVTPIQQVKNHLEKSGYVTDYEGGDEYYWQSFEDDKENEIAQIYCDENIATATWSIEVLEASSPNGNNALVRLSC